MAYVHEFSPTKADQPWIRRGDWYSRGSILTVTTGTASRPSAMKLKPVPGVMQHQCCLIGYNPEQDKQILCYFCQTFFHIEEMEYQENESLPDSLSRLIRGYGWEIQAKMKDGTGWSLVGNRNICLDGKADANHVAVAYTVREEEEAQALQEIRKVLTGIKGTWICKSCDRTL